MKRDKRAMKVCGMSGYHYMQTPTITLKGSWLDGGFVMGTPVSVQG